jgi:hypothetical protein
MKTKKAIALESSSFAWVEVFRKTQFLLFCCLGANYLIFAFKSLARAKTINSMLKIVLCGIPCSQVHISGV